MDLSPTSPASPESSFISKSNSGSDRSSPGERSNATDQSATDHLVSHLCSRILARLSNRHTIQASYRFQFHGAGFRFADALHQLEYLRDLGVSHVYSSPLLRSQSGSTHGYDVIDPTAINEELGSESEFLQLLDQLRAHGLGHILDIVPNHMSVASDQNHWWMDVLKHGPASRYANFFDIDWQPPRSRMHGRVLLPILPAASGKVLESGALQVRLCNGSFTLECNSFHLPLDPKSWVDLLAPNIAALSSGLRAPGSSLSSDSESAEEQSLAESASVELQSIIAALKHLPDRESDSPTTIEERARETHVIEQRLSRLVRKNRLAAEHIGRNLQAINGIEGQPATFNQLDQLLEQQAYRLVNWRASSDEINYRRFFDVSTLAALSIENIDVFETTHRLLLQMTARGLVDAFRVDHVDGLFDPTQYLWRLQWGNLREIARHEFEQLPDEVRSSQDWDLLESELLDALYAHLGGAPPQSVLSHDPADQSALYETLLNQASGEPSQDDILEDIDGQASISSSNAQMVGPRTTWPINVYVEKILGAEEPLPTNWPVLGTTGYEYLNELNGLFINDIGFKAICKSYQRFVGDQPAFEDIVYECKRIILSGPMRSEVTLLANRLERIANRSRYWRDYTLNDLEFALQEIIACHSVYRTYIRRHFVSDRDRQVLVRAVATAKRRNPASETDTFDFVRDLLLSEPLDLGEDAWREREYLVGRFQQVTSPVQAKGVEDTAFYRYIPLVSIDEVGGEPSKAVKSVTEFHQQNLRRQADWPGSMLTTTTHDTKRSEDVRARINVLSEVPGLWQKRLQRWFRLNKKHVRQVDSHDAPCRNDQWLIYQTLVGVWPVAKPDVQTRQQLIERLVQYMEKATHEAKMHTSWIRPNAAYDLAVQEFIVAILSEEGSKFDSDLQAFVDEILDAGLMNAASQVLLKLTSPGMPDIYQGQELWDFSLVDPDNRRPVNYDLRRHLLRELQQATSNSDDRLEFARYLARNPRDNRLKLFVTLEALAFRNQLQLGQGSHRYTPLDVSGPGAEHWVAYAWHRTAGEQEACEGIVIAPRMVQSLAHSPSQLSKQIGRHAGMVNSFRWCDTYVQLVAPPASAFKHAFTHMPIQVDESNRLSLATLVSDFPFVILY